MLVLVFPALWAINRAVRMFASPPPAALPRLAFLAWRGDVNELEALLKTGVSPDAPVAAMATEAGTIGRDVRPLYLAAQEGQLRVVKALLSAGADPRLAATFDDVGAVRPSEVAWECVRPLCWLALWRAERRRRG
jgi:hypothetical protein